MEAISKLVASYLLNAVWQIAVIAALGVFCDALLRRRMPSRYRHVMWLVCLGACLSVPLVTLVFQAYGTGTVAAVSSAGPASADGLARANGGMLYRFHARSHAVWFPSNLLAVVVWSYVAFLMLRAIRFGWGYLRTVQIRKKAYPRAMPPKLSQVWEAWKRKFLLPPIPVLCSGEVGSSSTLGYRRPVLLLPDRFFADELGEEELMAALAHELAHVRRRDFGLNLLYEVASLPICFHPMILLIKRRLAQTRELACDEMAAALLPSVTQYARSLVRLAQTMFAVPTGAKTSYAMGLFDTSALEERIMNILDTSNKRRKWARTHMLIIVGIIGAMSLAICGFSVRVADQASAAQRRFVGTWEAQYKGRAFFTLNLKEENGRLGGTCVHAVRVAYVDGELIPGTDESSEEKIWEARITGNKLKLTIGDPHDPILLDFTLINDHEAEGKPIVDPGGTPPPPKKAWLFERVSANP